MTRSWQTVTPAHIARAVRRCLAEGKRVEIDGLGEFRRSATGELRFLPRTAPQIFLAYADEDVKAVLRLHRALSRAGMLPWIDKVKLLPGQNWPRAIERAITMSDFFVPCFSQSATCRRGRFHAELRYAMHCASELPLDEDFILPVRLEDCQVPRRITQNTQYVDLFPDWRDGVARLVQAIENGGRHPRSRLRFAA